VPILLFLLGIILPFQLALIPLYQLMRDLQLLGTYTSLIIFYTGHQLPFTVFLYTGFLRALPRGYEEAALIDGASQFQAFRKIVFPLLRPVTGTVIILNAIFVWNDFLTPLLYVGGTPPSDFASGHILVRRAVRVAVGACLRRIGDWGHAHTHNVLPAPTLHHQGLRQRSQRLSLRGGKP
jgi:ABC-type glycerol-3-phosphate transport system permease component